jgi:hypothetical protein
MLSLDAFLTRILPSTGDIVVVQLLGTPPAPIHYAFTTIPQAVAKIRALEQIRANIYIALAGYKPGSVKRKRGRTGENATHFRSLWLDLDIGSEAGKYPSQREAAAALKEFIDSNSLPAPLVVSSGGGLHVYWPFDVDVDQATWKPLAEALKARCLKHGLKIDVRCTADAARILRPVETTNWKTGTARKVLVKIDAPAQPVASVRAAFGLNGFDTLQHTPHKGVNGNTYPLQSLDTVDPDQFDGQKILDGCQQMQWSMQHPEDVHYDMWRMQIGMLYKSDAPHLIHTLSQGHPNYDHDQTEAKARDWKGTGALCTKLEQFNPGGCTGCPHFGVIKSPSAIGFNSAPAPIIQIDPVTSMPNGWFHQDNVLWAASDDGPVKIYDGFIDVGVPYSDRNHLGQKHTYVPVGTVMNGARTENIIDYTATFSPGDLYKALTTCGIIPDQRNSKSFLSGMRSWLQEARTKAVVMPARRQLGWDTTALYEHDVPYILGETAYQPDGLMARVRLSDSIKAFGKDLCTHGALPHWRQAYNLLGMPGYDAHMVLSWIAFAAPLIRLEATPPAMVHAYSQTSSQGKTSVLNMINSVYGDPVSASMSWSSNATANSIQTALSILNGVPMGVDEITRLEPEDQYRLLYECTQQMGRKRLKQDGSLQESTMTKTMLYSTGNTSLQNIASVAVTQLDDTPLQARLVEIELVFPPMTPAERSARRTIIESVKTHFGHAAPVYISYVVRNQAKVAQQLASVRKQLETATGATNLERFQISSFAAMITGAYIARHLKLIDHPVERGIDWVVDWFAQQQDAQHKAITGNPLAILERMISDFQQHTLTVDRDQPFVQTIQQPKLVDIVKHPVKELYARYALEDQRLYIIAIKVKRWLVDHQLNPKTTLNDWHKAGLLTDLRQSINRLGGYTKHTVERQRCYIFDVGALDTLQDSLKL